LEKGINGWAISTKGFKNTKISGEGVGIWKVGIFGGAQKQNHKQ
jgi:hypothetical protein